MPGKIITLNPSATDKDGNAKNKRRAYADGKVRYRARWHSVYDKRGERAYSYRVFAKKSDARIWLDSMDREDRAEHESPTSTSEPDGPMTYADLVAEWSQTRLAGLAPRTQTRYDQVLRTYLVPAWGSMAVADITRKVVKTYFNQLALSPQPTTGRPMTAGTIKKIHTVASSVFSEAVELDYMTANPVAKLNAAKPIAQTTEPGEQVQYLNAQQIEALADSIPAYRVAILTAGHAGPRASELWALRVRDCDLEHAKGPRLHIRRALKRTYGQGKPVGAADFGPPKNGNPRTVRIPQWLADELAAHIGSLDDPTPDRLMFTAPAGGVVRHELFMARRFRPAVRKLGTPIRFHDLRHSYASMLIADGANEMQVQARLGHSDARSTAIYSHLFEGHDDDLLARMDAAHAERQRRLVA